MKNNQLDQIEQALQILSEETDTDKEVIVEELMGICWDEEEANEIIIYIDD